MWGRGENIAEYLFYPLTVTTSLILYRQPEENVPSLSQAIAGDDSTSQAKKEVRNLTITLIRFFVGCLKSELFILFQVAEHLENLLSFGGI